jgi:hypothetical protein
MKKLIVLLIMFFLVACSNDADTLKDLSKDADIAKAYLEQHGYKIIGFEEEKELIFTPEQLEDKDSFESKFWAVQPVEPDTFLNVPLQLITFTLINHLQDEHSSKKQTIVSVLMHHQDVIGGTSTPDSKASVGGTNPLHGDE